MITRKGLHVGTDNAAAFLVGVIALAVVYGAAAGSLDVTQVLNLITITTDNICNVVSMKGEAESYEVKRGKSPTE